MALLICPDCGNSVSDAAQACTRCGRPRVRNGSPENWKRKHSLGGQIASTVAGLTLIVLTVTGVKALLNHGKTAIASQRTQIVSKVDKIATGEIDVPAGKAIHYTLEIRPDMLEPVVASGGSGNDIVLRLPMKPTTIHNTNNFG